MDAAATQLLGRLGGSINIPVSDSLQLNLPTGDLMNNDGQVILTRQRAVELEKIGISDEFAKEMGDILGLSEFDKQINQANDLQRVHALQISWGSAIHTIDTFGIENLKKAAVEKYEGTYGEPFITFNFDNCVRRKLVSKLDSVDGDAYYEAINAVDADEDKRQAALAWGEQYIAKYSYIGSC